VGERAVRTAFTSQQYEHPYPDGIEAHYWTYARNRIVKRRLEHLDMPYGARVLDVGCGRGITVDFLRQHGFEAWGCDVGRPVPITAAVAPYLRVGTDALKLDEETREAVRAILLLDVLEHLEEPTEFLTACRERFRNCTHVLVTLPARMEIWSNYDDYYGHFRRYDEESLKEMVPSGAFDVIRQGYCFHLLYPPARLLSALGRARATEVAAPSPPSRWVHRLVGRVFDLEDRVLPRSLTGTSIVAILRVRR
jgi:SAM-dependent methyltransferase